MIRIFNHYLHRASLFGALADALVVMAVVAAAVLLQTTGSGGALFSVAGARGGSLAAGIFVINSLTGFYEPRPLRSSTESLIRAAVALNLKGKSKPKLRRASRKRAD